MKTVKIQKKEILFFLSLCTGAILYVFYFQTTPMIVDESFYPTIALRLINGDSLVADEWHLSQFSSLFLYLPVKLWLAIKGSSDRIVIFLRYLYLCIHTGTAVGIYVFFRKHGYWAILAALLFYSQSPMGVMSLNYNSLFALFLLATCLLLLSIRKTQKPVLYVLAGLCYACAGICNPFFFGVFLLYAAFCLFFAYKNSNFRKQNILIINKERKKHNKKLRKIGQKTEEQNIFFSKQAFLWFLVGIAIVAVCLFVFFLATGGSFDGFFENIKLMLTDSEHDVFESPLAAFASKLKNTATAFNTISFGLFFLPILLFAALLIDKKRKENIHRLVYICLSFALSVFYIAGISTALRSGEDYIQFFSLPLLLFSVVCYILTKHKKKSLFYCFWLPCALAALAQFLASNLLLWAIGWVFAIGNIAGIFMIKDLFCELQNEKEQVNTFLQKAICVILCLACCTQISFNIGRLCYSTVFDTTNFKSFEFGPYENLYVHKKEYGTFELSLRDLDKIKQRSDEDDPVLILSDMTWLYLYIDRPFGTYSAWQLSFEPERLAAYYEMNPEKTPKYIYISAVLPRSNYGVSFKSAESIAATMQEQFTCKQEKLSRGILLTVTE